MTPTTIDPTPPTRRLTASRVVGPVLALLGVALVAYWVAALPHRTGTAAGVVETPAVVRTAPLEGTAVPAGQQRLYAGETAHLADGSTVAVYGPEVGVPAGSAIKLADDALIPVAFTIDVTAGATPMTVRPSDFSVQIGGASTVIANIFGALTPATSLSQTALKAAIPTTGSSAPVTIAAHATHAFTIPLRIIARTGYVVYAPAGQPLSSWIFTAEDD